MSNNQTSLIATPDVYTRTCGACRQAYQADDHDDPHGGAVWAQRKGPCCYSGPVHVDSPQIPVMNDYRAAPAPWADR